VGRNNLQKGAKQKGRNCIEKVMSAFKWSFLRKLRNSNHAG